MVWVYCVNYIVENTHTGILSTLIIKYNIDRCFSILSSRVWLTRSPTILDIFIVLVLLLFVLVLVSDGLMNVRVVWHCYRVLVIISMLLLLLLDRGSSCILTYLLNWLSLSPSASCGRLAQHGYYHVYIYIYIYMSILLYYYDYIMIIILWVWL